ncbi:hypothetical protein GP475_01015 [Corynebacterium poyangense]|uniref:Uncharacterized protein n=1 Tax=Corynebacterium poyangense TaxID=2684405 RepID=A0A7H0SLE5_9CORY|nr:hypothetical protein [Corynebacterium poyangense]MBZ8177463.1 hypothetical protein [Corynebacterium poyangense]QNQ89370.1 hypothetical protein GP475_01015 [Corynebacterium poyangense]
MKTRQVGDAPRRTTPPRHSTAACVALHRPAWDSQHYSPRAEHKGRA